MQEELRSQVIKRRIFRLTFMALFVKKKMNEFAEEKKKKIKTASTFICLLIFQLVGR